MTFSLSSIRLFLKRNHIFFTIAFGLIASFGILYAIYHPNIKANLQNETGQEQPYGVNNKSVNTASPPRARSTIIKPKTDTNQTQKLSTSQSVVQSMNDSPGGIQIGVNQAPVTINTAPPPKPFDERLRNLLDQIEPEILKQLKKGHRRFQFRVQQNQFDVLKSLCLEKEASTYIHMNPHNGPNDEVGGFSSDGYYLVVDVTLSPELLTSTTP